MATDARKHVVPAGTDSVGVVAALAALSASIRDIIQVDNTTARAAVITALTGAGIGPTATNPVYVHRTDAAPGHNLEVTTDGSNFETFLSKKAVARGEVTLPASAVGALVSVSVTFPVAFAAPPNVQITPTSTRFTCAAVSVTTTGFTLQATNWSSGSAGAATAMWRAEDAA